MGWRFRRSISILPWLRLNYGNRGFSSVSLGPRGFSLSTGKSGTRYSTSFGYGLSYSERLDRPVERRASVRARAAKTRIAALCDEGQALTRRAERAKKRLEEMPTEQNRLRAEMLLLEIDDLTEEVQTETTQLGSIEREYRQARRSRREAVAVIVFAILISGVFKIFVL